MKSDDALLAAWAKTLVRKPDSPAIFDTRGEVLSAERVQYDGRDMHRVKVVDDQGRVRVFMQDPEQREGAAPARGGGNNGRGQTPRRPPARDDDD